MLFRILKSRRLASLLIVGVLALGEASVMSSAVGQDYGIDPSLLGLPDDVDLSSGAVTPNLNETFVDSIPTPKPSGFDVTVGLDDVKPIAVNGFDSNGFDTQPIGTGSTNGYSLTDSGMANGASSYDGSFESGAPASSSDAGASSARKTPAVQTVAAQDETVDELQELNELENRLSDLDHQIASIRSRRRYLVQPAIVAGRPRAFVSFESVLVQPAQSNNSGLIVETDAGYSQVMFPWQVQHSPRVTFGHDSGRDSLGWRVRYWQFRHSETFTANAANGLLPVGYDGTVGYLSEDGDVTTGLQFIEEGEFKSHIRTDVIDWELSKRLTTAVSLYSGVRFAKIQQGYWASTDQGRAWSSSQFRGMGPTIALQFEHRLPLERLMLFTNARGALLFGHKDFSAVDDEDSHLQLLNEIDLRGWEEGADSVAGNAEIQLGIQWDIARWINTRVALEVQHFDSVGGANPPAVFTGPDGGLSTGSPLDDNLSLFGLSVATELAY